MKRKKIKATYRNGVIEPLDRIDLPEGQELESNSAFSKKRLVNLLAKQKQT